MGSAMLHGWLSGDNAERVYVLDPAGLPDDFAEYAPNPLTVYKEPARMAEDKPEAYVFVIAVKPQIMDEVCDALKGTITPQAPVLSIAAGQTISNFEKYFGQEQPIIRAMPNTPAAISKGITVAVANDVTTPEQKDRAATLLRGVSIVEWAEDENLLDPVTAVSGSGPAYVFLLIETLAEAGVKAGLDEKLAMKLARQTVIGSAALAETNADISAATLRENVTSPGGTTAAALEVLMNGELQDLFDKALAAATARGKELSGH